MNIVIETWTISRQICIQMFCSSHFWFLVFGHFWQQSYENMKILHNFCLHFAKQDGEKTEQNQTPKVTKILKTKRRKYGMNETIMSEKKCFILKLLARDFYSFHYPTRFYMIKDGYVSKVFFSPQLWLSYSGLLFLHIIWNFTLLMSSANFSVMRDDVQTSMHFSFFSPSLSLTLTPITVPSIKFKFSGKATKFWLNLPLSFDVT